MTRIATADAVATIGERIDARLIWRLTVFGLLTLLVMESIVRLPMYGSVWLGHDYHTYIDAAERWLAGGGFYPSYQLDGPFQVVEREVLYPPVALVLFAPFSILPAIMWWAPVPIIGWVVYRQRPSRWQWVLILMLLTLPIEDGTSWAIEYVGGGNPGMWTAAFVALATRYPVFGPVVLVKPTLAPFALVGIRTRAWWVGLAVLGAVSLLFGSMWLDYLTVVGNARTDTAPFLYSLSNVTLCLIPLVASRMTQGVVSSGTPRVEVVVKGGVA